LPPSQANESLVGDTLGTLEMNYQWRRLLMAVIDELYINSLEYGEKTELDDMELAMANIFYQVYG